MITAAIAGIDNALWDIKGKAANLPIFRLLGGTRTQVPTYATGGFYVIGEGRVSTPSSSRASSSTAIAR